MPKLKVFARDRELFDRVRAMPRNERRRLEVSVLPFDTRCRGAFRSLRLETLGEVQDTSDSSFLRLPNFGLGSLKKVHFYLDEVGLAMGEGAIPDLPPVDPSRPITADDIARVKHTIAHLQQLVASWEAFLP